MLRGKLPAFHASSGTAYCVIENIDYGTSVESRPLRDGVTPDANPLFIHGAGYILKAASWRHEFPSN
jgi:hypothetical protein